MATTIGLQILALTKEADSDRSFERRIHTLAVSGVNVGTKNHSRKLVPKLRHSMHKVLIASIELLLTSVDPATGREPVFATIIDKATVDRETGQMHGVIAMIRGVLVPIFLSTLLAPNASGEGLADLLIACLMKGLPLKLSIELLLRSYSAFAADGQYQSEVEGHASGLAVQQHLCKKLGLSVKCLLSRWDGAHRLELGQDTVREAIAFYKGLAAVVADAQEKHLYGKGFDRVKQDAKVLGVKLAAVGEHRCCACMRIRHCIRTAPVRAPLCVRCACVQVQYAQHVSATRSARYTRISLGTLSSLCATSSNRRSVQLQR